MASAGRYACDSPPKARAAWSWPTMTPRAPRPSPADIGGLAVTVDVGVEADVRRLVDESVKKFGPIDLFCSNAGIAIGGSVDAPDADWQKIWDVNLMAHVYAARAVLPAMLERGEGYLLQTASAAGLVDVDRIGSLRGHQARRGGAGRVAVDHLRTRDQGFVPLPAGRVYEYVDAARRWASRPNFCGPKP